MVFANEAILCGILSFLTQKELNCCILVHKKWANLIPKYVIGSKILCYHTQSKVLILNLDKNYKSDSVMLIKNDKAETFSLRSSSEYLPILFLKLVLGTVKKIFVSTRYTTLILDITMCVSVRMICFSDGNSNMKLINRAKIISFSNWNDIGAECLQRCTNLQHLSLHRSSIQINNIFVKKLSIDKYSNICLLHAFMPSLEILEICDSLFSFLQQTESQLNVLQWKLRFPKLIKILYFEHPQNEIYINFLQRNIPFAQIKSISCFAPTK